MSAAPTSSWGSRCGRPSADERLDEIRRLATALERGLADTRTLPPADIVARPARGARRRGRSRPARGDHRTLSAVAVSRAGHRRSRRRGSGGQGPGDRRAPRAGTGRSRHPGRRGCPRRLSPRRARTPRSGPSSHPSRRKRRRRPSPERSAASEQPGASTPSHRRLSPRRRHRAPHRRIPRPPPHRRIPRPPRPCCASAACRSASGDRRSSRASTSTWGPASSSASSARPAPARRASCGW